MRVLVIVRHILPFVVSFLRDRHRWIIAGRPVARTEEFHGQRAEELVAAIGTHGPTFVKLAQDYAWRADGIESQSGREIALAFGIVLFVALFSLPFHWIGFVAPHAPRAFAVGAVLMDVGLAWLLFRAVRLVLIRRRYGRSWLRFARFPFRAGDRVELSLDSFGALSLVPSLLAFRRQT